MSFLLSVVFLSICKRVFGVNAAYDVSVVFYVGCFLWTDSRVTMWLPNIQWDRWRLTKAVHSAMRPIIDTRIRLTFDSSITGTLPCR